MSTKLVPYPIQPSLNSYDLGNRLQELVNVVSTLNSNQSVTVHNINEALKHMGDRIDTLSGFNDDLSAKIETLMNAIRRDLPAVTEHCPTVLAVASEIAIKEGGME